MKIISLTAGALLFACAAACAQSQDGAAAASQQGSEPGAAQEAAKVAVVMDMVDAWNRRDWRRVVDLFAEDGVLHSMMVEPIVGRQAIGTRINHMAEGLEEITLNVKHVGVVDEVVFIERVDEFIYNGHAGKVPVVGVIEVENGLIKEWREYYDRRELLEAMGLERDFDAEAR